MNIARKLVLALIWVYQHVLAPHASGACRFQPSCSNYARDAVKKHGAARGVYLAARRLMKCHPLGSCGYDPVP